MDILGNLAQFLDRPGFPWKTLIIGFGISQYLLETWLSVRQHHKLCEDKVPKALDGVVSKQDYDKAQAYGRAKSKFGFISSFYGQLTNVGTIHFDLLPKLWGLTGLWMSRYAPIGFRGEITHSIVFFVAFNLAGNLANMPLQYYKNFVLEEKFGFNKQTKKLFFTDAIRTQLLIAALGSPVLAGFLKIVSYFGGNFFYYLWLFILGVQTFLVTVYPIFILPMFNKLTPLEDGKLKSEIEALATRLNFPLKHLYVIDGSKRSAHSNAYFYGLPWSKQIVIYDTLIEKSEISEVVAVLAHELGHWKEGHTTKQFAVSQFYTFGVFVMFSLFINNRSLFQAFGFEKSMPTMIGFLIFGDILTPVDTVLKLLMNIMSRKFEYEADAFAVGLGYEKDLAKSLIKLQVQNLSTMDADYLYSAYHFTHPILPERLRELGWKGGKVE
ncbi:peptidase family M48-domain-containing protein [Tricharina praecox]|uniref:peptidase family M48-domain-containing protein n=1 Tax=Tricharina praecox TaxID=43433 RepID=UPI002220DC9D|nr:peptidase family M48-domain-containing protein [Tricharina praecox]KAI5849993.1 peptidase family M48-domain-containing protein [Tricharina praecox]